MTQALARSRRDLGIDLALVLLTIWVPLAIDGITRRFPRHLSPADETAGFGACVGGLALLAYLAWRNGDAQTTLGLRRTSALAEIAWAALLYVCLCTASFAVTAVTSHVWPDQVEEPWSIPFAMPLYLLFWAAFEEALYRASCSDTSSA